MMLEQNLPAGGLSIRDVHHRLQRDRLRGLAVIGLGYWGPNWVRNIYHGNRVERLVCCDLDSKRRTHLQQLYPGVETTPVLNEILEDPEDRGRGGGNAREQPLFDRKTSARGR
jgi:PHP family Zn ribbon phosphoesterase